MTYSDKLKSPLWQKKRLEILQQANFKCEDCGRSDMELQVHHCAYITGLDPHEYDAALLMCVCPICHNSRQEQEDAMRVSLGKITRFLSPERLATEAWNIIDELSQRETQRLAAAFSTTEAANA